MITKPTIYKVSDKVKDCIIIQNPIHYDFRGENFEGYNFNDYDLIYSSLASGCLLKSVDECQNYLQSNIEAVVIKDKYTGRSKGFGFVTFANEADAEKAVTEMAEKEVDGRKIVVNVAKPREEGGNRGGGGFQRNNQRRF